MMVCMCPIDRRFCQEIRLCLKCIETVRMENKKTKHRKIGALFFLVVPRAEKVPSKSRVPR